MMIFKHKRTEYKIEADERQYIFSKKTKDEWEVLGYYHDILYLLFKLIKIGCINVKKANSIDVMIKQSLITIERAVLRAVEPPTGDDR